MQPEEPAMRFLNSRVAALLLTVSTSALALTITVTDPTAKYHDQADNCPPSYPQCYDDAYLQTAPLNAGTAGIRAAFDEWNTIANPNDPWSLRNGGFLDATLEVDKFRATIDPSKVIGGVEIHIIFNYTGADKNDFFWAQ